MGRRRPWGGLEWRAGEPTVPVARPRPDVRPLPRSSHNWNSLFMGPSAVADAIAQKYSATKSQVFDHVSERASAGHTALGWGWAWQLEEQERPG